MDLYYVLNLKKKQIAQEACLAGGKVFKRGDIIRTRQINYELRAIKAFRVYVKRNHLKHELDFYETMPDAKANVKLVTKMFALKAFLGKMFPPGHPNIGAKVDHVKKNIFVNDYLCGILNESGT